MSGARQKPGAAAPPASQEAVFAEPWEARAFALAVTLCQAGRFSWDEFRDRLITEIARADAAASEAGYYECWLAALEDVVRGKALLDGAEIEDRAAAIAASPPARTRALSRGPIRIA
jgi:nitrile hydratase accessory protein